MKSTKYFIALSLFFSLLFSSCATIIGGSKYYAHIVVADNPNARIIYKGEVVGTGSAVVNVRRIDADRFSFNVKQDGFNAQTYNFNSRSLRGWAFVGTVLLWTGIYNGIPLPWGIAVDLATGALWKPDVNEKGVSKDDYKNFRYLVSYGDSTLVKNSSIKQFIDVLYLKNGSIIKGQIIEHAVGGTIKIQTKDESVFVFKEDEVNKIVRE